MPTRTQTRSPGAATPPATSPERPRTLTVQAVSGEADEWDGFLARTSGSTFCHLAGWRPVMEDVLGHDTLYLAALDDAGEWRGVLPLVHVRSRLFGNYLLSMPFLNYGGPIGTARARRTLIDAAVDAAEDRGVDLLELRNRELVVSKLQVSSRKVTVLLDLPDTPEELWEEGFRSKLRSSIRRGGKEGVEMRFGRELVEDFYRIFSRKMRDLGTPVLPRRYFEAIAHHHGDRALFGVAYHGDRPVAAGYGIVWQGEFEMTRASTDPAYDRWNVNELMYWSFMERVMEEGVRTFNFGRCTPGTGGHRFKLKWGGRDVPLPWLQWVPAATPSPDRPLYRFATGIWKRLPLGVSRWLGPKLAAQLP